MGYGGLHSHHGSFLRRLAVNAQTIDLYEVRTSHSLANAI